MSTNKQHVVFMWCELSNQMITCHIRRWTLYFEALGVYQQTLWICLANVHRLLGEFHLNHQTADVIANEPSNLCRMHPPIKCYHHTT
jgi:hypothetical protein